MMSDEFYVGYLPRAPAGFARRMRAVSVLLLAGGVVLAMVLAGAQKPFDEGFFEFGVERELAGVLHLGPVPWLEVTRPGTAGFQGAAAVSRYMLVALGKHGAGPLLQNLDGHRVALRGTLISSSAGTQVEVVAGSVRQVEGMAGVAPSGSTEPTMAAGQDLGVHTVVGEIVDSKCYLGVMKPGREKPHRACAVRCISGGIPPALLLRDPLGRRRLLLLVDADGSAVNKRILDRVAEPLEVTGRITRHGDLLVLAADPATYRRLKR